MMAPGTVVDEVPGAVTGSIPIRNLWHMLLYVWKVIPLRARWNAQVEQSPSLDALLASVLASLIGQRLRIGLGRDYLNDDRVLRGIRGRIDFPQSLRRLAFENGQAYCRFQSFTTNVPKNQIVRSTLARLVKTGEFGPDKIKAEELKQRLRRLVRVLDGIDLIEISPETIRRQHLGRNDDDYRLMLAICELVLQRQVPTELAGLKRLPGLSRDGLTLHRIYERFVANFYKFHLKNWSVFSQRPLEWHSTKTSPFLPMMFPDLILRHRDSGQMILLDTKFTAASLSLGRSTKQVFESSHIYQLYAYLRSQEHLSENHRAASGLLLYPTVLWDLRDKIELQGHLIRFETIDLAQPWEDIENRLLQIVPDGLCTESEVAN